MSFLLCTFLYTFCCILFSVHWWTLLALCFSFTSLPFYSKSFPWILDWCLEWSLVSFWAQYYFICLYVLYHFYLSWAIHYFSFSLVLHFCLLHCSSFFPRPTYSYLNFLPHAYLSFSDVYLCPYIWLAHFISPWEYCVSDHPLEVILGLSHPSYSPSEYPQSHCHFCYTKICSLQLSNPCWSSLLIHACQLLPLAIPTDPYKPFFPMAFEPIICFSILSLGLLGTSLYPIHLFVLL